MELTKIELENFKCFREKKVIDFKHRTIIKGRNGLGKSTIYDAVMWLLFDKNMFWSSATNIRPHTEDGKDIDFVEINVAATFNVDGREITLSKVQKQKWVSKRGSAEKTFQGNENVFSVNDIPKSQKEFKAYVSDNFCADDVFLACTNALSFFKLDTKKRRAKLMTLATDFSDSTVIEKNPEFTPLAEMLVDGTVEELITRSKQTKKKLDDELKSIPIRIDEVEKQRTDIDFAEHELAKKELECQIKKTRDSINIGSSTLFDLQTKQMTIQGDMSVMAQKAEYDLKVLRNNAQRDVDNKYLEISNKEHAISHIQAEISSCEDDIARLGKEKDSLVEEYKKVYSEKFDTTQETCSYCGQRLPEEEIEKLIATFEDNKSKRLESITNKGNSLKIEIEAKKNTAVECNNDLGKLTEELKVLRADYSLLRDKLADIPSRPTESAEYLSMKDELSKVDAEIEKLQSTNDEVAELQQKLKELEMELSEVNSVLAKATFNNELDERIAELKSLQLETAQKCADEDKMINLLEKFNVERMNMLSESVNKKFKVVKWKLFEEQINGGYAQVCKCLVNGTDYENGLNHGDRILADVDILSTFQAMNNVQLPIFVDDSESVDAWRVPNIDSQTILLRRTDDKEMRVEYGD